MQRTARETGGESLFLSQLDLIERVIGYTCARQHIAAGDAEDFASYVKLKLIENDYALLDKFQGRSSLRTFLTVVIQRMFLDYRVSTWGKWRPSAQARRAGPIAILLERLMGRDGYPFQQACEVLRTNHRVDANQSELERLAGQLPMRTRRRFEPDEALEELPSGDRPIDNLAAESERQAIADRVADALPTLMTRMEVQDRLILTLRFEDGRTVAEIATILRLDQKALYRRVERLLKELRQGLEAQGLDCASVLEMLDSPAVILEWKDRQHAER